MHSANRSGGFFMAAGISIELKIGTSFHSREKKAAKMMVRGTVLLFLEVPTRYNSKALFNGPLAQRSEHTPYKGGVDGSNPSWSTNTHGEIPKWLKGLVLKTGSGVTPSWGSNPHFSAI